LQAHRTPLLGLTGNPERTGVERHPFLSRVRNQYTKFDRINSHLVESPLPTATEPKSYFRPASAS
jgi:hypothetical protein